MSNKKNVLVTSLTDETARKPQEIAQKIARKLLKIAQNCSKSLKSLKIAPNCLKSLKIT
jgi:hypothetical protein